MSATLLEEAISVTKSTGPDSQVVALHLGKEIYGVDIASIHSVLTMQPITTVPNVPHYVRGVMNLRGTILPVMDLRARFRLPLLEAESVKSSRIVIVETNGLTAGLIVDSVSEVITISADAIEPPSALLGSTDQRCLTGIGRVPMHGGIEDNKSAECRLILLLNIYETITGLGELAKTAVI